MQNIIKSDRKQEKFEKIRYDKENNNLLVLDRQLCKFSKTNINLILTPLIPIICSTAVVR